MSIIYAYWTSWLHLQFHVIFEVLHAKLTWPSDCTVILLNPYGHELWIHRSVTWSLLALPFDMNSATWHPSWLYYSVPWPLHGYSTSWHDPCMVTLQFDLNPARLHYRLTWNLVMIPQFDITPAWLGYSLTWQLHGYSTGWHDPCVITLQYDMTPAWLLYSLTWTLHGYTTGWHETLWLHHSLTWPLPYSLIWPFHDYTTAWHDPPPASLHLHGTTCSLTWLHHGYSTVWHDFCMVTQWFEMAPQISDAIGFNSSMYY